MQSVPIGSGQRVKAAQDFFLEAMLVQLDDRVQHDAAAIGAGAVLCRAYKVVTGAKQRSGRTAGSGVDLDRVLLVRDPCFA